MNTTDNNKLIAEFMGITPNEAGVYHISKYKAYDVLHLSYHKSWDWLMPVVEKISDIKSWSLNATLEWLSESQDMDGLYTKEDVYEAVVEFINQYNK
tara:strand:+ start:37 stop:327 length:291 start_codon:yes stop_codon:yes gene_type:complete